MAEYGRILFARSEGDARTAAEAEYGEVAAAVDGLSDMEFLDLGHYFTPAYRVWGWRAEAPTSEGVT